MPRTARRGPVVAVLVVDDLVAAPAGRTSERIETRSIRIAAGLHIHNCR
jgi:hypothetical protein